jgi:enoyl-CoA hydratase/carnithine racemase
MLVSCQNAAMERALNVIFDWFEREPTLYVAVLGSTQKKAWCAGQDLKEMVRKNLCPRLFPMAGTH